MTQKHAQEISGKRKEPCDRCGAETDPEEVFTYFRERICERCIYDIIDEKWQGDFKEVILNDLKQKCDRNYQTWQKWFHEHYAKCNGDHPNCGVYYVLEEFLLNCGVCQTCCEHAQEDYGLKVDGCDGCPYEAGQDPSVLLSIHEEHLLKMIKGEKDYEFRKQIWKRSDIKRAYLYVTAPVKRIAGYFTIANILTASPDTLWGRCAEKSGLTKDQFFTYFQDRPRGYAIKIRLLEIYKMLKDPRELFDTFHPPQNFTYLSTNEVKMLECGKVENLKKNGQGEHPK